MWPACGHVPVSSAILLPAGGRPGWQHLRDFVACCRPTTKCNLFDCLVCQQRNQRAQKLHGLCKRKEDEFGQIQNDTARTRVEALEAKARNSVLKEDLKQIQGALEEKEKLIDQVRLETAAFLQVRSAWPFLWQCSHAAFEAANNACLIFEGTGR